MLIDFVLSLCRFVFQDYCNKFLSLCFSHLCIFDLGCEPRCYCLYHCRYLSNVFVLNQVFVLPCFTICSFPFFFFLLFSFPSSSSSYIWETWIMLVSGDCLMVVLCDDNISWASFKNSILKY